MLNGSYLRLNSTGSVLPMKAFKDIAVGVFVCVNVKQGGERMWKCAHTSTESSNLDYYTGTKSSLVWND